MPQYEIRGVPVDFPFEPYKVQRDYMEKVIECLQTGTNGVLESPTGTGKTLSLLCATLGWIITKKAQVQASKALPKTEMEGTIMPSNNLNNLAAELVDQLNKIGGEGGPKQGSWGIPKVIYASRTHSQLAQAMAELKRTHYCTLKTAVIGSRDQLCIHPEVSRETGNSNKLHMCRVKVLSKTCSFYQKVDSVKDRPEIREKPIMDIEDLVQAGRKYKCCPYYLSKEMIEHADIVFMPYNYLLDPKARRANKIELQNSIIILDEAHNVEKICEDAASIQLKSSDLALCIEEVTSIMKALSENKNLGFDNDDEEGQTFTLEDLATLKEILLSLERAIDAIQINFSEGSTFAGDYVFELLTKANITDENCLVISKLLDDLIQFVTTMTEKNGMSSRAVGLSLLSDMLTIVFSERSPEFKERIRRCYKVHIAAEEQKSQGNKGHKSVDGWTSTRSVQPSVKTNAKVVSYWCFNPGFGMTQVLRQNVHSVILTSGTLAPLKPLISELGIPVDVRLENPHIIGDSQVFVKIISHGPDKEPLISNYENRNNPKYIQSLGRTVLSFCPIIPAGLLIFFPSYTILNKCQEEWIRSGIWGQIQKIKPIFIEPRTKDEFNIVMSEYYFKINDTHARGAIFMAVCRGKVSEGLDFADMNGRGVIITGLPFPPIKDPRIVLKKRYLEENRSRDKEMLSGNDWYGLEATRAVNQAIGRVIRHKNDYGAILLCDGRFSDRRQRDQLSRWVQSHLKGPEPMFGKTIGELSRFFRNAEKTLPSPTLKPLTYDSPSKSTSDALSRMNGSPSSKKHIEGLTRAIKIENSNSVASWDPNDYHSAKIDFKMAKQQDNFNFEETKVPTSFKSLEKQEARNSIDFNDCSSYVKKEGLVSIHKRNLSPSEVPAMPRKRFTLVSNAVKTETVDLTSTPDNNAEFLESLSQVPQDRKDLLGLMKTLMDPANYKQVLASLTSYKNDSNVEKLLVALLKAFKEPRTVHLLVALGRFVKDNHKCRFKTRTNDYLKSFGIEPVL